MAADRIKSKTVLLVILLMLLGGGAILLVEKAVRRYRESGDRERCVKMMRAITTMARMYGYDTGKPPASLAALRTSRFNPHVSCDPWGRDFVYANPAIGRASLGDGFTLYSLGPDGIDQNGEGDDVTLPSRH